MPIFFYKANETHGYLSNFAEFDFYSEGVHWKTSEHYYQAHKFSNEKIIREIIEAPTPQRAADLAYMHADEMVENWEKIKEEIMYKAIENKFEQNLNIKKLILDTRDELLIEAADDDGYWGYGCEKKGKNRLGSLIMKYRSLAQNRLGLFHEEK